LKPNQDLQEIESKIKKKKREMKQEKENETDVRKLNFLKKIQRKILQGGYQISSDTMLGNMASIDEGEKSLTNSLY
jgi:hypothetical protein